MYAQIGSIVFPIHIDSQYSEVDRIGKLMVNAAFKDTLSAHGVKFEKIGTVPGKNCDGVDGVGSLYHVDAPFNITADARATRQINKFRSVEFVETRADECDPNWSAKEPIVWLGAAYLRHWGTTIIDPMTERVWIQPSGELDRFRG